MVVRRMISDKLWILSRENIKQFLKYDKCNYSNIILIVYSNFQKEGRPKLTRHEVNPTIFTESSFIY